MPFILSTATGPISYVEYGPAADGNLPVIKRSITIKGGANLNTKTLVTPRGVATKVTDEELAFLRANKLFCEHQAAGFMTVTRSEEPADKVARDMAEGDGSRPLTEADYRPGGRQWRGVDPETNEPVARAPKVATAA